jgi:hypothetical protein
MNKKMNKKGVTTIMLVVRSKRDLLCFSFLLLIQVSANNGVGKGIEYFLSYGSSINDVMVFVVRGLMIL